ncbi:MAG: DNA-directed DNA polymerase I [Desulfurococcales archaeon]|nr:DNA-directed DNA polymerase I [Desulfurococcales archaeon]
MPKRKPTAMPLTYFIAKKEENEETPRKEEEKEKKPPKKQESLKEDRTISVPKPSKSFHAEEAVTVSTAVKPLETSRRIERRKSRPKRTVTKTVNIRKSSGNTRIIETIVEPRLASNASGYILEVYYDGDNGKASVAIYNPHNGKVHYWLDNTGHRPYFYTDASREEVLKRAMNKTSFRNGAKVERVEYEVKKDLLSDKKVRLTKIIVSKPTDVPILRGLFERHWESDIPYHHNYVYDKDIVPGMPYNFSGNSLGRIEPVEELWKTPEEFGSIVERVFQKEDEETRRKALQWIPIFEAPPPHPRMAAIDIEVLNPPGSFPNVDEASHPIISISVSTTDGVQKVYTLYRDGLKLGDTSSIPKGVDIELFDDERGLILSFLAFIKDYPVVFTFNGDSFDMVYLHNRALVLGIPIEEIPLAWREDYVTLVNGVHIDLYRVFDNRSLQIYAFGGVYREKNLDAIASALLGISKIKLEKEMIELSLAELVSYNYRDASLTLSLATFNDYLVWDLLVLIQRISKLGIEDVSRSQVSSWIKSLFYWEHRRHGYLIPRRDDLRKMGTEARSKAIIKEKKYQGAIVFDPPQGVFFNVIVLDFASLYPSIIKNWNLSYETLNRNWCKNRKEIPFLGYTVCFDEPGLTSQIVGLLRDFRVRIYKKKAKDKSLPETERKWYNVVQAAMKVYINASYGVFGAEAFKLYSLPVAESVTAIGRSVILDAKNKAEELNLYILYGDTDSLFIWSPPEGKLNDLRKYVWEKHGLELEVDKIYKLVLFSGLKKNYLGIYEDGSSDIKGMVGKKSNTPEFLKQEFNRMVGIISEMNGPNDVEKVTNKIRDEIEEMQTKLRNMEYTLDELAFKVMLQKGLHEYNKTTPQHVKAAKLLRQFGVNIEKGDVIMMVKTRDKRMGVKPVQLAKVTEVDQAKYIEYVKTTFEQILQSLGQTWEEISRYRLL